MPRTELDTYTYPMRDYIMECLKELGKTFDHCEECGISTSNLEIHHTKYVEATIYDLRLVCLSCNRKAHNLNLV